MGIEGLTGEHERFSTSRQKAADPRKRRVEASKESPLALTVQQNNPKYDQQYDRDQ